MKADFWHDMWASGEVGFHQADINAYLKQFWAFLNLKGDEQVLVPLCGKSLDMLWLVEEGHDVLGVELSQQALDEFLAENKLDAKPVQHENYCGYDLEKMTLLCGDFFHLSKQDTSHIQAVYDRAALVALPPEMRKQYAQKLAEVLPTDCNILLVTMEYDQSQLQGPPFSVPQAEVFELFESSFQVQHLESFDFERKGVKAVEKVYLMQKLA